MLETEVAQLVRDRFGHLVGGLLSAGSQLLSCGLKLFVGFLQLVLQGGQRLFTPGQVLETCCGLCAKRQDLGYGAAVFALEGVEHGHPVVQPLQAFRVCIDALNRGADAGGEFL